MLNAASGASPIRGPRDSPGLSLLGVELFARRGPRGASSFSDLPLVVVAQPLHCRVAVRAARRPPAISCRLVCSVFEHGARPAAAQGRHVGWHPILARALPLQRGAPLLVCDDDAVQGSPAHTADRDVRGRGGRCRAPASSTALQSQCCIRHAMPLGSVTANITCD